MASRGVNKVILVGNIGQDPEIRYMPNGSAVANISLATSESWKDKNTGQQQDKTEWHRVVLFAKLAEIVGEYCRKGSQIYIEGKLQTRKWTDQQGQEKYTTEIVVDGFDGKLQLLGGKSENSQANQSQGSYQGGQQQGGGYGGGSQQAQSNNSYAPQQQSAPAQQQQRPQQQPAPQQQSNNQYGGGYNQQQQNNAPQQGGGFAPKPQNSPQGGASNPMEPPIDFDDEIPF